MLFIYYAEGEGIDLKWADVSNDLRLDLCPCLTPVHPISINPERIGSVRGLPNEIFRLDVESADWSQLPVNEYAR